MVIITGAAGFIGSNLAHRLARLGHELWLVDRAIEPSKAPNWAGLERFRFTTDGELLRELSDAASHPVEAVFHLGACSSTTETDWSLLHRNNVEFSRRLWEWCSEAGRPFYYASSAATYGDGASGFSDRIHPSKLAPLNLYGKSKNDFDLWALGRLDGGGPTPPAWAGLKFFNVYGPRESHKGGMASVVWQARRQITEAGEVRLFKSNDPSYPDGGQRRDFVFVEDCIDHMLWLWEHPEVAGIFNSGSGLARTFDDLALAVFSALGREPRIRYVDLPGHLARQYQNFTEADMSTLRDAGYSKPATLLEEGVARSLAAEAALNPPTNPAP